MAVKARAENKALTARIAALEAKIAELSGEKPSGAANEAASKPRAKK